MNAKRVKAIRRAIIPGREHTGTSRGRFEKGTTLYAAQENRKKYSLEFPLDKRGGWSDDFIWFTGTVRLEPTCPRAMVKQYKEIARRGKL